MREWLSAHKVTISLSRVHVASHLQKYRSDVLSQPSALSSPQEQVSPQPEEKEEEFVIATTNSHFVNNRMLVAEMTGQRFDMLLMESNHDDSHFRFGVEDHLELVSQVEVSTGEQYSYTTTTGLTSGPSCYCYCLHCGAQLP